MQAQQEVALVMSEVSDFVDDAHKMLVGAGDDEVRVALNYIAVVRGMSQDTIRTHKIGYCHTSQELPGCLTARHYGRHIWGRIVIPIYDEFGELISFATRSCIPSLKGWWHIPFRKSNYLFMLDKSRRYIFEKNKAYVVEGFLDSIIPFQYSVNNISSVMGTELSDRRIGLLSRYCDSICFCFDTDVKNEAGQEAQLKSIAQATSLGVEHLSQIKMPPGVDPDEFVIKNGAEAFYSLEQTVTEEEQKQAQQWLNERSN